MKARLQRALYRLDAAERSARTASPLGAVDGRAKLLATVVFLATMLSLPLGSLSELLLYALFPLATAAMGRLDYGRICRRSLIAVPFVAFVGLFNVLCERTPVLRIGPLAVTEGWLSLLSLTVRGMLSVQALLVLIESTGFHRLCRSMQLLGVPALFTTQLLFVHRYLFVLTQEALALSRARDARSFGRASYPLRTWATLVGQLLIRSFERAERIDRSMRARGFTGRIPAAAGASAPWSLRDSCFAAGWSLLFVRLRTLHPAETLGRLLTN